MVQIIYYTFYYVQIESDNGFNQLIYTWYTNVLHNS